METRYGDVLLIEEKDEEIKRELETGNQNETKRERK